MQIWTRIRQLSLKQLWKFFLLFLKYPLYVFPTIKASRKSMKTCNLLFGMSHHGRGQANAFRHAYWNYEICRNCLKRSKNVEKSIVWAKKLTDLYEKVTRNDLLDQAMDFHNNEVGRAVFSQIGAIKDKNVIEKFQNMAEIAEKVSRIEEIDSKRGVLIYLKED